MYSLYDAIVVSLATDGSIISIVLCRKLQYTNSRSTSIVMGGNGFGRQSLNLCMADYVLLRVLALWCHVSYLIC